MTDTTPATPDTSQFWEALRDLRNLRDVIVAARIRTILATMDTMGAAITHTDVRDAATAKALRDSFAALANELDPPK